MYQHLTIFLTKGMRIFSVLIMSLASLWIGYASDHMFYRHTFTCRPRHRHYVTVLMFVCLSVRMTLIVFCFYIHVVEKLFVFIVIPWFTKYHCIDRMQLFLHNIYFCYISMFGNNFCFYSRPKELIPCNFSNMIMFFF